MLALVLALCSGRHARRDGTEDSSGAASAVGGSTAIRSDAGGAERPAKRDAALSPEGNASLRRGAALLNARRPKDAENAFRRAIRADPDSVLAYDYLGISLLQQGRFEDALPQFQEEIRLDPRGATGWARVADVYYAREDIKHAVEALEQAVVRGPNIAQLHFNLCMLYQQAMQLTKAVAAMDRCVALQPQNHYAFYIRGNLFYKLAKLDDAERDLNEAIRLDPRVGVYHFGLAQIYLRRITTPQTTERARQELETALGIGMAAPAEVHYHLGLCYQRQAKYEDARRELETSVRQAPEAWSAQYALADVLLRLGRTAEAAKAQARFQVLRAREDARMKRSFYTQEVQRQPDSPDARIQLAEYLAQTGEKAQARRVLAAARRLAAAGKGAPGLNERIASLSAALVGQGR